VLQALDGEQTVSKLAEHLDLSRSYISELICDLEDRQLVYTHKEGKNKLVNTSEHRFVEKLQQLNHEYPHIDFSELLTSKTFTVLYYLDEKRTVSEIADLTGEYRNTVNRIINKLTKRGVTGKDGTEYHLNDQFQGLNELAQDYTSHKHRSETPASTFSIVWEGFDRFLVETNETLDDERFTETGPQRFEEFGIPLLDTSTNHYLHTETDYELTVPELINHTLLIDSETRHQTYCLLLIEKHDPVRDSVLESAKRYGTEKQVERLYEYLKSKGEQNPVDLPQWDEFAATAADYGIQI